MTILSQIIKISRPKFWIYTAGPLLIGYVLILENTLQFFDAKFFLLLFYFILPANIIIYGVNDYFDLETDKLNKKKEEKEGRLNDDNKNIYIISIVASILFTLPILLFMPFEGRILLLLFFLIAIFYSAPPLRFKIRPFFDSASNFFYVLPGFIAVSAFSNSSIDFAIMFFLSFYTMALHLYSAIIDIEPDQKAGITTTAVWLGKSNSLILSFVLWLIFFISVLLYTKHLLMMVLIIYPLFAFYSIIHKDKLDELYWKLPYINFFVGLFVYWAIAFIKFV
jgi:lycopene elongase/hydratase (dihydrobisanhydrobacterioruberin-forming)